MILSTAGQPHLTYCTNIHPGETWPEIQNNLKQFLLPVKALVSPSKRFGIGLRLSAQAVRSLNNRNAIEAFREFLVGHNLYLFTINGFPYGTFHGTQVKEKVYRPDWLEEGRLIYSDLLATVLGHLLPSEYELTGSVSTVPGAFKARIQSKEDIQNIANRIIHHAKTLYRIYQSTGRMITLALEPEPYCFLETIQETIAFFHNHLFGKAAIHQFSQAIGLNHTKSEDALRQHLGVCLDACHAAVEFEDPVQSINTLQNAGIKIAKLQVSTGLRVSKVDASAIEALDAFAEGVYLHQVVEHVDGIKNRYLDLPEALASARKKRYGTGEWRIHFHVPVFLKDMGLFENTQEFLESLLTIQANTPFTQHLEVETYTWDVLPQEYREENIVQSITRELTWVIERMTT